MRNARVPTNRARKPRSRAAVIALNAIANRELLKWHALKWESEGEVEGCVCVILVHQCHWMHALCQYARALKHPEL